MEKNIRIKLNNWQTTSLISVAVITIVCAVMIAVFKTSLIIPLWALLVMLVSRFDRLFLSYLMLLLFATLALLTFIKDYTRTNELTTSILLILIVYLLIDPLRRTLYSVFSIQKGNKRLFVKEAAPVLFREQQHNTSEEAQTVSFPNAHEAEKLDKPISDP